MIITSCIECGLEGPDIHEEWCSIGRNWSPRKPSGAITVNPEIVEERGWVLEKGPTHRPKYWCVTERRFNWTEDHLAALRFSRRSDAEQMGAHFLLSEVEHRIAEHAWESHSVSEVTKSDTASSKPNEESLLREVERLRGALEDCTDEEAEYVANQCDHFQIKAPKWWSAVKRGRKVLATTNSVAISNKLVNETPPAPLDVDAET